MTRCPERLALLSLLICGAAAAQTTGRVEGTVRDRDGSPLPSVSVEAESSRLQGVRGAVTDSGGRFRLPELPPGRYLIRFRVEGFSSLERDLIVSLDAPVTLDVALDLAVAERVAVSADARRVDLGSTTTGTNYTGAVVAGLPIARNYADVVRSNPGVTPDKGETQGRSLALAIYGATSVENQWLIDGVNTTHVLKGFQGKAINSEFVEEVEVKTGGYQAEYGRALGGIVNVITKSGGNQFHGDAFLYYDSSATRAQQIVTSGDSPIGMRVTPNDRRDYGFDLGGYFIQDRLWFYAAYDRVETPGTTSRYFGTDAVPDTLLFPLNQTDNLYSGKLSWNLGPGSSLVTTVFGDPSTVSGAALGATIESPDPGTWETRRSLGGNDYGLRLSQIAGTAAVFSIQASRHEDRFELFPSGPAAAIRLEDWTCDPTAPGTSGHACQVPAEPNSVSGGLGQIDGSLLHNSSRRGQLRGDGTFYPGAHEIKAGADYQDGTTTLVSSFTGGQHVGRFNEHGQLYYVHNFYVKSLTDPTPIDNVNLEVRAIDKGAFVQDMWRIGAHLTINAGLRWDEEDLRDYAGVTIVKTTAEWQPRVGIAWDPSGRGQTKVFAFAGRFYLSLPTDLSVQSFSASVFETTFNFDPVSLTSDPNVIGHPPLRPNTIGLSKQVESGLKGMFQDEIAVGAEMLLDPTFSIGLKATYRRLGRAVEDRCDLDLDAPENNGSSCAIINPGSNGSYARGDFASCTGLDPPYGQCGIAGAPATPAAERIYQGIEILARKTVAHRLWLQASYAYSSLRGNFDGGVEQNFGAGQTDPGSTADFDYPPFWRNANGRLFLDRPHQARLDVSYTAPNGLFGGLGAYVQSGAPLNQRGYFNEVYGGANIYLVPRGTAGRMPTLWEANLTVGYPIKIGPVAATLQAYVYNVFNNQIATNQSVAYTANQQPEGYPATLYDPNVPSNNPLYGKIFNRQDPRLFRAAVRVSF